MIRLLITATAVTLVVGCDYSTRKDNSPATPGPGTGLTGTTSYQSLQKDLFTPFCADCHNAARGAEGIALDSYRGLTQGTNPEALPLVTAGRSDESLVYAVIANGTMPKGAGPKPPAQLLADLKAWIDAGAAEAAVVPTQPAPAPPAGPVMAGDPTFKTVFDQIFKPKCAGCHQLHADGRPAAGGVPLSDYDLLLRANEDGHLFTAGDPDAGILVDEVVRGDMPPRGDKLSATETNFLKAWIKAGAPRG